MFTFQWRGGWEGIAERRGRRGPLLWSSRYSPKCLEHPWRSSLLTRPIVLPNSGLSFHYLKKKKNLVVRRQNCYFCLMYHVSYMCYHGVSVSHVFARVFPTPVPVTSCMACVWGLNVCAYIYRLLGQCFVDTLWRNQQRLPSFLDSAPCSGRAWESRMVELSLLLPLKMLVPP